ncbi:hypothetical protein AGMMS50276_03160 [Synergistales bacterium]|nr:hypothetical protein AGMMS50276_03160 [Synergistales bacterium]
MARYSGGYKREQTVEESLQKRLGQQNPTLKLFAIVENSPQFVCCFGSDGTIEYANEGAAKVSGYFREEIMLNNIKILFDDGARDRINACYENARKGATGEIQNNEKNSGSADNGEDKKVSVHLRRRDGSARVLQIAVFPIDNTIIGMIGIDITEEARLKREIIKAKEQAEQSNIAKTEFLARMSHEIRTPMNAIMGMTSIGKASGETKRKDYCLEKISEASIHLLGIINDILDMSKIEAGKFDISLMEFKLERMLQRVSNIMEFRMNEKNIDFHVRLDKNLPAYIISDDQRLAQVITNLLANAVKFTPENGVITLYVCPAKMPDEEDAGADDDSDIDADVCELEFCVEDNGIGISAENQKKLFRSFEQADGSVARKYGGTGLGLSISKRIIELLGGKIWIESEEGKGSRFIFRIMAMKGKNEHHYIKVSLSPGETLNVLVVDDSLEVLQYFASLVDRIDFHCDTALSGEEACNILSDPQANYKIVFIDWRMPGMDGIELTRIIKERYGDKIVVVMISAAEWGDIEAEARAVGVDDFISKPLFPSSIVDCINEFLGDDSDAKSKQSSLERSFAGHRILLVEDVEINREIVISLLEETGIAIDCAENGKKAVEVFEKSSDRYDLIFMDINMPEMDGYQATQAIRAMPMLRAREIPIVAMTANVFREDVERCIAYGMNDHIGKPVEIDNILSKLFKYIKDEIYKPQRL